MAQEIKIFLSVILLTLLPFYGAIYTKADISWPVSVLMYNLSFFYLVSVGVHIIGTVAKPERDII